ncbi:hypothetical protein WN51_10771 [Melipona quadrifasciata]|uniref:Uncharacterized protein n=1 Tax=Melipona quadrifasciata TaxID=166423 RepID=A0A0M9A492_9HYME|nr:hypothetical protein WN51_10771 [Melipona quadrifasciata]
MESPQPVGWLSREQPKCETIRDENCNGAVLGAFDDNPGRSILLSRLLLTRNTQNYHFQQNGLQPEIFVHCPFHEICGYRLDGCAAVQVDSSFTKMDRPKGTNTLAIKIARSRDVGFF